MFKKLFMMLLVSGLLVLGSKAWAADNAGTNSCGWTNMKFAQFLGERYEIKPIEGSVDEQYQALTNALSQKGINYFLNTKPNDKLSCCGAADALYAIVGAGKEAPANCDLKINYLIQNGILKLPATGGDPCGALCNVPDAFAGVEKFQPVRSGPPPINPPEKEKEHW
jgi:hypothetical protein